jgi:uncharacterized GH25 family protein
LNSHHTAVFLGALVSAYGAFATAHDFWVQPNEYWISANSTVFMTLQVGHGPFRQRSPIPSQRITRFQAIGPRGSIVDLHEHLRLAQATEDADFPLKTPGAYVLVLQTDNHAQTQLPAIRFNDYLKAEGLTPALEERLRLHRMDADGSERYSRCAKSIMQVGPADPSSQAEISKPVGLPLEIVPESNIYAIPRSASLPIRVIYEEQPLAGALVMLTDLSHDASPVEAHLTDRNGHTSFTMPGAGTWLLNVIWTRPLSASEATDFETVFSSLSFGFPFDQL